MKNFYLYLCCLLLLISCNGGRNKSHEVYSEEEMLIINQDIKFGMTIDTLYAMRYIKDINNTSGLCFGRLTDSSIGTVHFEGADAQFINGKLICVQYTSIPLNYDEVKDLLSSTLDYYKSIYRYPVVENEFPSNIKPQKTYEIFKYEIGDKTIIGQFCKSDDSKPAIQTDVYIFNKKIALEQNIRHESKLANSEFDTLYSNYYELKDLYSKDWPYCEYGVILNDWGRKMAETYKYVYNNEIIYIDTIYGQKEDFDMFRDSYLIKKVGEGHWVVNYKRYLKDDKIFDIKANKY